MSYFNENFTMAKELQEFWYEKFKEEFSDNDLECMIDIIESIRSLKRNPDPEVVEWRTNSHGASITIPRHFLESIGVTEENPTMYIHTTANHSKLQVSATPYQNEKDPLGVILLEKPQDAKRRVLNIDRTKLAMFSFTEEYSHATISYQKRNSLLNVEPFLKEAQDDFEITDENDSVDEATNDVEPLFEDADSSDK